MISSTLLVPFPTYRRRGASPSRWRPAARRLERLAVSTRRHRPLLSIVYILVKYSIYTRIHSTRDILGFFRADSGGKGRAARARTRQPLRARCNRGKGRDQQPEDHPWRCRGRCYRHRDRHAHQNAGLSCHACTAQRQCVGLGIPLIRALAKNSLQLELLLKTRFSWTWALLKSSSVSPVPLKSRSS